MMPLACITDPYQARCAKLAAPDAVVCNREPHLKVVPGTAPVAQGCGPRLCVGQPQGQELGCAPALLQPPGHAALAQEGLAGRLAQR